MPDLLFELFSEEIPARMQRQAAEDLKRLVTNALVERGLVYEGAAAYATPRRLALQVVGRLSLHAGRDFFAEKFEQKIGHRAAYSSLCEPSQSGSFLVCLQPQKKALPVASAL